MSEPAALSCSGCSHRPVCRIWNVMRTASLDVAQIAIADGELDGLRIELAIAVGSRCLFHVDRPEATT